MIRSWLGLAGVLASLTCCAVAVQGQPAQSVQLQPVDEAKLEPALLAFRTELLSAVRARRADGVLGAMSPNVRQQFQHWLRLPSEAFGGGEQEDWSQLEDVLVLGGSFTTTRGVVKGRREFCAPYVYSAYPHPLPADLQGERAPWVLLESDVEVHQHPDPSSDVLRRLSFALVKADGGGFPSRGGQQSTWALVQLPGGRTGYVRDSQIRDPDGYHACFALVEGNWKMVRFERGLTPAWTPIR